MMIRTHTIPCLLPKPDADALNRESGRVYTETLVWHYRFYRRKGHWLSPFAAQRLGDSLSVTTLAGHSRDAAQQGFYKACKTAKACRKAGMDKHYPHRRKFYRTTVWKNTGIRVRPGTLLLSRARGLLPVKVPYETGGEVREARLVYDLKQSAYFWHFVIEDGVAPLPVEGGTTAAIDMGEIHPVAITDGDEVCILSCRELRSVAQGTHKRLAQLDRKLSRCERGSRRTKRLKSAKAKMRAQQKRRQRDLLHKVSRATIDWCEEKGVGTLAIGDVRDVADKTKVEKRLLTETRQKIGSWPHGTLRKYLGYKAEQAGIGVHDKVHEAHTSQTCLQCGKRNKPRGRVYRCPACKFTFARDGVGAANILSRFLYGELARVKPTTQRYRRPFHRWNGLRSCEDPAHVAVP